MEQEQTQNKRNKKEKTRNDFLFILVAPEEKLMVKRLAEKEGRPLSNFCRYAILEYAKKLEAKA